MPGSGIYSFPPVNEGYKGPRAVERADRFSAADSRELPRPMSSLSQVSISSSNPAGVTWPCSNHSFSDSELSYRDKCGFLSSPGRLWPNGSGLVMRTGAECDSEGGSEVEVRGWPSVGRPEAWLSSS